jgi:ferredoxin
MDCFLEGPNFLVINPEECIDCSMCAPECPVNAIVGDREIDESQRHFIDLNARLARHPDWKPITSPKAALPEHEHWSSVKDKLHLLDSANQTDIHSS